MKIVTLAIRKLCVHALHTKLKKKKKEKSSPLLKLKLHTFPHQTSSQSGWPISPFCSSESEIIFFFNPEAPVLCLYINPLLPPTQV